MAKAWLTIKSEGGFSVVEVLLASTVFGLLVAGLIGALVYGQQATNESGRRGRAVMLAEEGAEALRNIRDANYANLVDGTYGLVQSGNTWTLSGSSDTSGIYTRSVAVSTRDTNRKNITSTVTWPQTVGTGSASVVTSLANWSAVLPKFWTAPSLGGSLNLTLTHNAIKVATQGNYAYVVRDDGTPDFQIINVTNPASPTAAGSLSLSGAPTNVFVSGNYAYVTTTDNAAELRIINISNPASPTLAGLYNASGTSDGRGIYVVGTTAYLSRAANSTNDELVMVNVSNPAAPSRIAGFSSNITMYEVYVDGSDIFLATGSDTAEILKLTVSVVNAISQTGTINLTGTTDAITITGNGKTLYAGQGTSMYVINGTAMTQTGSVAASGTISDIALNPTANFAYVGTTASTNQFQVINVATPSSPAVAASVSLTGTITLSGLAYSATLDSVIGVSSIDTQEVVIFIPN